MYSYGKDSVVYSLKDSMIWFYTTADLLYSIAGQKDSVFYTATNGKVILATIDQYGESEKYDYMCNNDGMLTDLIASRKDTGKCIQT
jgi:hypothetical protein